MDTIKKIQIQPYARLLTMLSEQLIKNEAVALSEIVKNSYDADSAWVKITFENFTKSYKAQRNSRIVIEDCGIGMTEKTLQYDFINPASANKKLKKERGEKSAKGRILQGEKGIGRFSLFKLGKTVTVFTKTKEDAFARKLVADFSDYNDEFINSDDSQIMLSDLTMELTSQVDYDFHSDILLSTGFTKRQNCGTAVSYTHLTLPTNSRV